MTRRVGASLVAVLLLVGCGSGGGRYAADVCTALDRWVGSVNGSLDELREGTEERTSIGQERRAVLGHLADVQAADAALRAELRAAPDGVEAETELTGRLLDLVGEMDHQVSRIRAQVRKLEAEDVQTFRGVVGPLLGQRLGGLIRRVLATPLDAPEDLAGDFEAEPACHGVLSGEPPEEGPA